MRLLQRSSTGEFSLTKDFVGDDTPLYAILSHTWGTDTEEVTFGDLMNHTGKDKPGYEKILFCGKQAAQDNLDYFWIDTCCIDKLNSVEIAEAINSMFRWYRSATKCYVYLSDVSSDEFARKDSSFQKSKWFTRGWTLQELLAPSCVEFFSTEGKRLGDKASLIQEVHTITGIPVPALEGSPLSQFSIDERMSWAKERRTTREEDAAYSLLGIFNIHMPLIYGEGRKEALDRLRNEIENRLGLKEREKQLLRCLNASPYRARKDRNPDRVSGTCDWFISHEKFRDWQQSKQSKMLWVSADPGCGKSVLAKYLVDYVLPQTESRTVCYFFFKDDFDDQRSVVSALCCILFQIFWHKRTLLSNAILDQFAIDGENFTNSFVDLWDTIISVAEDKNAGEIICLLDALDECEGQGRSLLAQKLCQLYGMERNFNLKFLITSRPYGGIRRGFQPLDIPKLPMIHLSGESGIEMEKISQEIDIFIRARVQDIGARLKLTSHEQDILLQELTRVPNRTYLWVHLTLDLIESDINIDKIRILKTTSQLPETVDEAYNKTLSRSRDSKKAKKILHIVVAAARPLTLREMALAVVLRESHRSYDELDLTSEDRFREDVRDICGLFVTIIDSRIYLLHQTAREFLVQHDYANTPKAIPEDLEWKNSLRLQESHQILARICIWHLLLDEFEKHTLDDGRQSQYTEDHVFVDYSAKHWTTHLRELKREIQDTMALPILKLCDVHSKRCLTWFKIYWTSTNTDCPKGFTTLMLASYFGLGTVAKHSLKAKGINLHAQDATYQRSALSWAAGNGSDVVVKLLIESARIRRRYLRLPFGSVPEINSTDIYGRTPLFYAVWNGHIAIVKQLIKAGSRVDLKDEIGGTPLSYAVCYGYERMIEILAKRGTRIDSENDIIKYLLISAAKKGHDTVFKPLLETGKVDVNVKDEDGRTALMLASEYGREAVVKLLLQIGEVDIAKKGKKGRTALTYAVVHGHEAVVGLLLETGEFDINERDEDGQTALMLAAVHGHVAIARLLLETGKVDINVEGKYRWTALMLAAVHGHEVVAKLLLDTGKIDVNEKGQYGRTALMLAAVHGHEATVRLLLEKGKVDINVTDEDGRTALAFAVMYGHKDVAGLLLEA